MVEGGLNDLVGEVLVWEADFGSEAGVEVLFEGDFLDDLG